MPIFTNRRARHKNQPKFARDTRVRKSDCASAVARGCRIARLIAAQFDLVEPNESEVSVRYEKNPKREHVRGRVCQADTAGCITAGVVGLMTLAQLLGPAR